MKVLPVISAALLAATVALVPTAASAGGTDCANNQACLYVNSNFVGRFAVKSGGEGLTNMSAARNDVMSSWDNKTGSTGAWWQGANRTSTCRTITAETENASMAFYANDTLRVIHNAVR